MAKSYRVTAKVVSQKGNCVAGYKVGDEFVIEDISPKISCAWAFYTIFPFYSVLKYGGAFPWERNPAKTTIACPDPHNPVVFELRREIFE